MHNWLLYLIQFSVQGHFHREAFLAISSRQLHSCAFPSCTFILLIVTWIDYLSLFKCHCQVLRQTVTPQNSYDCLLGSQDFFTQQSKWSLQNKVTLSPSSLSPPHWCPLSLSIKLEAIFPIGCTGPMQSGPQAPMWLAPFTLVPSLTQLQPHWLPCQFSNTACLHSFPFSPRPLFNCSLLSHPFPFPLDQTATLPCPTSHHETYATHHITMLLLESFLLHGLSLERLLCVRWLLFCSLSNTGHR